MRICFRRSENGTFSVIPGRAKHEPGIQYSQILLMYWIPDATVGANASRSSPSGFGNDGRKISPHPGRNIAKGSSVIRLRWL